MLNETEIQNHGDVNFFWQNFRQYAKLETDETIETCLRRFTFFQIITPDTLFRINFTTPK